MLVARNEADLFYCNQLEHAVIQRIVLLVCNTLVFSNALFDPLNDGLLTSVEHDVLNPVFWSGKGWGKLFF